MPRQPRRAPGGLIYHVINRAAGRQKLFADDGDYAAFVGVMERTLQTNPMRVLGFCLMPTHWHLVLWPQREGELARFMHKLTVTHVRRWLEHRHRVGQGSIYQGRFKSFPTQDDAHLSTLLRYVERNPLRAGKVGRAEDWRWSSLGQKPGAGVDPQEAPLIELTPLPTPRRRDWKRWVNQAQTPAEEAAIAHSLKFSRPFGSDQWTRKIEATLQLPPLRPRGRPKEERKTE